MADWNYIASTGRPLGIFCGYEVRRNPGVFEFRGIHSVQRGARSDLRNRCLEPVESDSSRIPISLYFITSHPRTYSRPRYSDGIIAVYIYRVFHNFAPVK